MLKDGIIKKLYDQKMDLIELPFKYSLDADGFKEAKKDFENLLLIKN